MLLFVIFCFISKLEAFFTHLWSGVLSAFFFLAFTLFCCFLLRPRIIGLCLRLLDFDEKPLRRDCPASPPNICFSHAFAAWCTLFRMVWLSHVFFFVCPLSPPPFRRFDSFASPRRSVMTLSHPALGPVHPLLPVLASVCSAFIPCRMSPSIVSASGHAVFHTVKRPFCAFSSFESGPCLGLNVFPGSFFSPFNFL